MLRILPGWKQIGSDEAVEFRLAADLLLDGRRKAELAAFRHRRGGDGEARINFWVTAQFC